MSEQEKNMYFKYISVHFANVWRPCTQGTKITPVITESDINRFFGITLPQKYIRFSGDPKSAYMTNCNAEGKFFCIEQFEIICSDCNLKKFRNYEDIRTAYHIFRYNFHLTDELPLLLRDMYNGSQFHEEFIAAVNKYFYNNGLPDGMEHISEISIRTNPGDSVLYRSLIDYLHYEVQQPNISFTIRNGNDSKMCCISKEDYDAKFSDVSYNIVIRNIQVL